MTDTLPAIQPGTTGGDYRNGRIATDQRKPAQVVGLYSFPKSGNTWLRAIIVAICNMPHGPGTMQKYVTDSHFGPIIEGAWPFEGRDWYFYKSHRKTVMTEHKDQRFDTDRVVHIYRHPLDVFVSYLNFVSANVSPNAGKSLPVKFDRVEDLTPEQMEQLFCIFLEHATLFPQNRAFGNVFEHVKSFRALQASGHPVLELRYEDLQDDFAAQVDKLTDFLGFDRIDTQAIFATVDQRTKQNGKFFWKRQKENYRNFLTEDQIARFLERYRDEMIALGYEA